MISWLLNLFKQCKHFWRLAEMRLLFMALLVAVVAVTSVGFFTDRAERAMNTQATQLLGGDMVLVSSRPISENYLLEAKKQGMGTAKVISFPSMVSNDDKFQLARIKAVSDEYPFRKMPDQGSNAFQFAPTVVISLEQLASTGLLGEGSRATYSYLFSGDEGQIKTFSRWLKPQLEQHERIRTLDDGLPAVQQALQRGQRFLKMASLLAVILAGAGIALSSYSLTIHEVSAVAVLKTLGASRQYLQSFVGQTLPEAGLLPIVVGFATSLIMALGFSAPHLLQLTRTAPIQILQRSNAKEKIPFLFSFMCLAIAVFTMMWLQTSDVKLSLYLLAAVSIALLVFWFIALLMLKLLRSLSKRWKIPKANSRMALMVVVFGIGLFSLLLLTTLRGDLINRWQSSLPIDAPNHFLINIQPSEVEALRALLDKENVNTPLYPMIRGRLTKVNREAVSANDERYAQNQRAQGVLSREFNLSASSTMPEGNIIQQGEWFKPDDNAGFSMEAGIAENLGVTMGDSLTFDIGGQLLTDKITSIRTVQWDSMRPNFFVIATPSAFDAFPKTYITSMHLPDSKSEVLNQLLKQFPSVTNIDISTIVKQVRELINKAAFAVQAIFMFTLVAGVIVLFSALQSQKALRKKEIAVLKSLGASRSYLRRNLLIEFAMIGGLSGFLASILALIASNAAAYSLFELKPQIDFMLITMGVFVGALLFNRSVNIDRFSYHKFVQILIFL